MARYKNKDVTILSSDKDTYEPMARVTHVGDSSVFVVPKKDITLEHEQKLTAHALPVIAKDEYHPKYKNVPK